MGGFLASIFGGSNPTLNQDISKIGKLSDFSTNAGEQGTTAALNYDLGLLSGDPTKVAETLAPETQQAQQQAQQGKNTIAQFSNRGGGSNAVMNSLDDATRAKLLSLTGGLRQGAAGQAGQLGTANLGLAQNATMDQSKLAQERFQNWMNSILGKGITDISKTALNAGEAGLGL